MTANIKLKKSSIAGRIPTVSDLQYGEIAINYADGRLYFKTDTNDIRHFSSNDSAHFSNLTTDALTIGNYSFPTADGTSNQILTTDGNGTLTFVDQPLTTDSASIMGIIDSAVNKAFIDNLDVNAGTLDGQDGVYFLNYNNFFNTPNIPDSAFVTTIAENTRSPADSADILAVVDSNLIQNIVNEGYVATLVDSAYIAVRVGDFAENFGTAAVVGDLSIDATTGGDTLTFAAGTGMQITSDVSNKRLTFSSTYNQTLDFGSIVSPVGFTLDMGAI